jgi:acetolactate synthase-1/3 small subunit
MFIKVLATAKTRSQIIEIAQIFRSKIVDISNTSITLEVTGDPGKQLLFNNY